MKSRSGEAWRCPGKFPVSLSVWEQVVTLPQAAGGKREISESSFFFAGKSVQTEFPVSSSSAVSPVLFSLQLNDHARNFAGAVSNQTHSHLYLSF